MTLVLVVVHERVLMSISHVITVDCLRPHSPRLCFSDRVEIVPDEGESKRGFISPPVNIRLTWEGSIQSSSVTSPFSGSSELNGPFPNLNHFPAFSF